MKRYLGIAIALIAMVALSNCGKKSDDDDEATDSGTTPETITAQNPLASAYPSSLAVSAFPTNNSTTSLTSFSLADSSEDKSSEVKNEEAAKILKGQADSCVPDALKSTPKDRSDETCYDFDQDMIYGAKDGATYKGTKDGKNSKGEACLVAFSRTQVKNVEQAVDRALGTIQMMICQAKKKGVATDLAAAGDSLDLKASMDDSAAKFDTITTAKIERTADVTDGSNTYKSYKSSLEITRKDGVAMAITLYHVRKDDTNSKYYGVLQISETVGDKVTHLTAASSKKRLMSVSYGRDVSDSGEATVAYQLRNGIFAAALASTAYGSDNLLDLNVGADFTGVAGTDAYGSYTGYTQANDAVSGMTFIAFTGDPDTGKGTFSYWQNPGSSYTENARGMVASLDVDSDDLISGCAFSGAVGDSPSAGFSIRQALKEGKTLVPLGFFHPFLSNGTTGSDSVGTFYTKAQTMGTSKWYRVEDSTKGTTFSTQGMSNLVSKQCFKQDKTTKAYLIDTSIVTSAKGYEFVETSASAKPIEPPKGELIKAVKK